MIGAIKRGDAFAFEQAYLQSCGKVYAYFLKKTKSPEDAQDLMQTTYLKLWQYRRSLSTEFLLDQHLFQIGRTVFIDYLRRQNKRCLVQKSVMFITEVASSSPFIEFELKSRLQTVLSAMPEVRKKVFELNRLQGYSYREIAEHLSISVKSVDNNLSKALRQLRKVLATILFIIILFL